MLGRYVELASLLKSSKPLLSELEIRGESNKGGSKFTRATARSVHENLS